MEIIEIRRVDKFGIRGREVSSPDDVAMGEYFVIIHDNMVRLYLKTEGGNLELLEGVLNESTMNEIYRKTRAYRTDEACELIRKAVRLVGREKVRKIIEEGLYM